MSKDYIKKIKLPLMLVTILLFSIFFGSIIPMEIKSIAYAISLSMKSILELFLPLIIFSFIFYCLSNLQKGAILFVILLISCIFISNFIALNLGYASGILSLNLLQFKKVVLDTGPHLLPAWQFPALKIISNDTALFCGLIAGMYFSLRPDATAKKIAGKLNGLANGFLKKIFIPVLPLFILGFVFKLEYEKILQLSFKIYGPLLLVVIATQWLYIGLWYYISGGFSFRKGLMHLKNVLPASLTGLSTISSAASLPVLIVSTEKNLQNADEARMIVPAIINIHTIGSAIGIPILSLATISTFGLPLPSFSTFLIFAFYTALAKYAVAAVPGGVIIIVAPILEAYLGFSSEMTGLITAVYLICDPFGTTANVTANGVFPIVFTKLYNRVSQLNLPRFLLQENYHKS